MVPEYLKGPIALNLRTVIVHGFSLGWLAERLGLRATGEGGLLIAGASPWSTGLAETLHRLEVPVMLAHSSWHRLRAARLAGVPVFFGEMLSEHAEVSLELGEMGSLLAASDNDAYNALVCAQYASDFGRQMVYQLATDVVPDYKRPTPASRGLTAFGAGIQFENLERNWYTGWTFQRTNLTEDYDEEAFLAGLPEGALPLLQIAKKGAVRVIGAERPLKVKDGVGLVRLQAPVHGAAGRR
jgi:hypothetical protein